MVNMFYLLLAVRMYYFCCLWAASMVTRIHNTCCSDTVKRNCRFPARLAYNSTYAATDTTCGSLPQFNSELPPWSQGYTTPAAWTKSSATADFLPDLPTNPPVYVNADTPTVQFRLRRSLSLVSCFVYW